MCDQNVGVAKRLDLEKISKDMADFVNGLEQAVQVPIEVREIKKFQDKLELVIKEKTK